jgi:hypothetical protein
MTTDSNHTLRELDQRVSDGIDVRLLWRPQDDVAIVSVLDARTGESFDIEVREGQRALDVFHHPYAYAPEGHEKRPGTELTRATG